MTAVDSSETAAPASGLIQFIKFCIVGVTSTVVDFAVLALLTKQFGMVWYIAKLISFALSVTNGFIWNSFWTFRGMGSGKRHEQYVKFVVVNIFGLGLSMTIIKLMLQMLQGGSPMHQRNLMIGNLTAVVFVSVWNFVANRKWTYA